MIILVSVLMIGIIGLRWVNRLIRKERLFVMVLMVLVSGLLRVVSSVLKVLERF